MSVRFFGQKLAAMGLALLMLTLSAPSLGADPKKEAEHRKEDVAKHRAIAQAHESAAKCLEAGKAEKDCHADLQKACRGLAIGKYCGMKHSH